MYGRAMRASRARAQGLVVAGMAPGGTPGRNVRAGAGPGRSLGRMPRCVAAVLSLRGTEVKSGQLRALCPAVVAEGVHGFQSELPRTYREKRPRHLEPIREPVRVRMLAFPLLRVDLAAFCFPDLSFEA